MIHCCRCSRPLHALQVAAAEALGSLVTLGHSSCVALDESVIGRDRRTSFFYGARRAL